MKWVFPLLSMISILAVLYSLYMRKVHFEDSVRRIIPLLQDVKTLSQRHLEEQEKWKRIQSVNPSYLSEIIETMTLLEPEKRRVEALLKNYPDNLVLQGRAAYLQKEKNHLKFIPHLRRSLKAEKGSLFETEFKLENSVQLNGYDLRRLLQLIERPEDKNAPILFIKNFSLKKKKERSDEMVYEMDLDLVERSKCQ